MVITTPFLPRIYCLQPQSSGAPDAFASILAQCAAMGFDHVLLPSNALGDADIGALVKDCHVQRLQLLLDLNIGSVALDSELLQSHASWFAAANEEDDLPDPRRSVRARTSARFRHDESGISEEIESYWQQRMQAWLDAGVAGFRCVDLAGAPASAWQRLIAQGRSRKPAARFLAWTPGCTAEQVQALAGCGFDATFSSGAWWDFRSRWLVDEQMRLARVAPPIAFPDSPDEPVIARVAATENADARRNIYLRALWLAAAGGNGILVPMGFERGIAGHDHAPATQVAFDLTEEIRQANAFIANAGVRHYAAPLQLLSSTDARFAILMRRAAHAKTDEAALLIVASADTAQSCQVTQRQLQERAMGLVPDRRIWPEQSLDLATSHAIELQPAQLQVLAARRTAPILLPPARGKQAVVTAARSPRIAIEAVSPSIDAGRFAVKRTLGESVNIEADVFTDGHDKLAVALLWRTADEANWQEVRMHAIGNDRWSASLPLTRLGRYLFTIEAWRDNFATYRDELEKKAAAGLDVALELEEGRLMVEAAAAYAEENQIDAAANLKALAKSLKVPQQRGKIKASPNDPERIAALLSEPTLEAMRAADARPFVVRSEPVLRIDAERPQARFSSWYELFPRSQSGDPTRHGTFADVIKRLPAIQAMGFDTLYFTPIHPIGKKHRKGKNNSLNAGPDEPGSPYAIGSEDGGHDAIHPELGTIEDFRRLRDEAAGHGLELALDFAIQCSPDHPWLQQHPDWFTWRPDGTIRYAENPPKKYQDIVNVDFYADGAIPGLWIALRDAVLFWVKEGVRVFRVDNPHTKPLPFWEWMINDIRARYPDTIFLSEAFTRPKMMYRLAKVGYSQSYTYFTWRHTKAEFIEYMTELTTTNVREFFRPHFFVNTPDINPYFLQRSGRPGFLIRAALATTLSGLWGMYSGFELCEGTPVPGKEEYLDSEKYEIRAWDWQRPGNIIHEITALNHIRSENPALHSHLGIRFLPASNDNILFFLKSTEPATSSQRFGDNVVLVAINLDPFAAHEATLELPLWEFGVPDDGMLEVDDLLGGARGTWQGRQRHVRLDPFVNPYAIWRVRHQ